MIILESGADVMAALKDREEKYNEEKKLFSCLVELLSYEKITFNGEFTLNTLSAFSKILKLSKSYEKREKYFPTQKLKFASL